MSDARPDPAKDYVGSLRWMMDHIEAIERARDEERVGPTEAARRLGYPEAHTYSKPWRIPDYGLKGRVHSVATWRAWWERPEIDLRTGWDALSLRDRSRALGVSA